MYEYKDVRNFYFENETGKRIDCQKLDGSLFFYNVTGLGYEEEIQYEQIGTTFIPNEKKIKQNQIGGNLEFYDMTYDEYCNFVNFINQSNFLRLIYIPKTSKREEFFRDIDVCKIEKNEEDDFNVLTCPILMNCKSLWYKEKSITQTIEPIEDEVRWDFKWDSKFTEYDTRSFEYINEGHVEAPIEVEIDGHVLNPSIELYVDGELIQTVEFNVEIAQYEKLLYGTKENEFYVKKQNTDGTIEDLYKYEENTVLNFANDNVIRLPKNRSCEIRLNAETEIEKAKITVYNFYKFV